ncbi:MAG: energy transducer TonB [Candidatus Acidiferrales bacterium]
MLIALGCVLGAQAETIYDKDVHVVDYADMYFPAIALVAHVEGVVVVQVKLDDKGKVVEAEALSGPALVTRQTIENAKKWTFEPNVQKSAVIVPQLSN